MELSSKIREKIEKIRPEFPTSQSLLIPLLHAIQEDEGWISPGFVKAAAKYLELPLGRVEEVLTFYSMFNKKPVGKHHLQVCKNIGCWLNGSDKIIDSIKERLELKEGETTRDGKFTLSTTECLGSCGTAPVMQVGSKYHENMNPEAVDKLLDQLKKGSSHV